MQFNTEIGERIRLARERRKYTRARLADEICISEKHLYEIEKKGKCFSVMILAELVGALGVSSDFILFGDE